MAVLCIIQWLYNQMVIGISQRLDATFAALADPTRRAILARLTAGDASVTELAKPFAMSQPAISKHLKVLERAGLISRSRDGQRRPRRLEAKPLAKVTEWLEGYRHFWEGRFQRLDALLDELKTQEKKSGHPKRSVDLASLVRLNRRASGSRPTSVGGLASTKRTGDHR
jgi:DNA-binding transcriptional ArsR family regulator